MPRREILTSSDRMQLLAFPEDEGELIRRYTLTKADLAFARQHRGDHNRLGIAVQMCFLRFPGRVLGENERPPDRLLNLVATQLGISTVAWDMYGPLYSPASHKSNFVFRNGYFRPTKDRFKQETVVCRRVWKNDRFIEPMCRRNSAVLIARESSTLERRRGPRHDKLLRGAGKKVCNL
jgi:Domain of unknown function (DUF4158)